VEQARVGGQLVNTYQFKLLALEVLAVVLVASAVAGQVADSPANLIRGALAAVGGAEGALVLPRTFRSELTVESYNDDDGFVRDTVTESLVTLPEGSRFRSDHCAVKPEQGMQAHNLTYYRAGKDMWRVAVSQESGELQAERIPFGNEEIRTLPHSLRYLAYAMAHPERFRIAFREEHADSVAGRHCRVVAIDIAVDNDAISYRAFVDAASGLPVRLVTVTSGCVIDYNDWRRISGLMLPAEVISRQDPDPANASAGYEVTTRLQSVDLAPVFAPGYFDLPAVAIRED
jgi:hypothetical protein